jgi:hypothetical protein
VKVRNDFIFNKKNFSIIPAGCPIGYSLDRLSLAGGGASGPRF